MKISNQIDYFVEEYINDYGWVKVRIFTCEEYQAGLANNYARQLCKDTQHKTRVIKVVYYTELVNEFNPG